MTENTSDVARHNQEIQRNLEAWQRKPLLRKCYRRFHERIAERLGDRPGLTVELGSGIGNIKDVIPDCIRTDLFANPWIDQVENAYDLSFGDASVANLILFDVFHHLRYPGTALREFARVTALGGRLLIFEPCLSLLGRLVYGKLHHEGLGIHDTIAWEAPVGWSAHAVDYYAAQGNATRIFINGEKRDSLTGWRVLDATRQCALSYVATGGYSGPQLYPTAAYGLMCLLDVGLSLLPAVFAARLLVVLERCPEP